MITYIKRKDLDIQKYDDCIEQSLQSNIYGFSWYLDIVADNWDALVLDDYKAVMPVPWREKYFIKYVYPPFWLLELGIYSKEIIDENEFLKRLFSTFKYIDVRTNRANSFKGFHQFLIEKEFQKLSIDKGYSIIRDNFKKDRKKDLQRAEKFDLIEKWNDNPKNLIQLFKENVGKRTPNIKEEDYLVLEKLISVCIEKKKGKLLSIYNKEDKIVASGFFLKHQQEITILISSTDFENRKNGANTFLIDRSIYKFQNNFKSFNFGGSSIKSVASFFKSFNANTEVYKHIKMNKLPFVFKLFKR